MCDSGRLDYKWIGSEKRLSKLNGTTDWTTILAEITTNLEKAAVTSVAIIASARQTNEELFLLKKLADKFEAITDSVPRNGEGDHLLVNADKNPNSNGARLIGIAGETLGANLPAIAEGIGNGTIKSLIVFGEDVTQHGISAALLEKLDLLIVSDIFANATTARAHYLLPGCAYAEKRGTFTNVKGQVQKFMKALDAPGNARAEWEFLHEIEGLFNQMAGEVDAFKAKELNWAALGDDGVTVEI
jgi:NADH-quinone oxidoreductase subunit G